MKKIKRKVRIVDALNTYNHALSAIKGKGYEIFLYPDEREEFLGDFWAFDDERDFVASDPLRLLGLIALWEVFGDNWRETEVNEDYDETFNKAFSKDFILQLNDEEYTKLTNNLIKFFNIIDIDFPINPTREEVVQFLSSYYLHSQKKD